MKINHVIATALPIVILYGCAPKSAVSSVVKSVNIQNDVEMLNVNSGKKDIIQKDWWLVFDDTQLNSLIGEALENSPNIKSAQLRVKQAKEALNSSKAVMLPQIDFGTSVSRERFSENYIYPPPYGGSYYSTYQVGASLNYDFDFWNAKSSLFEAAKESSLAHMASLEASRLSISSEIAKIYVSWYYDEKAVGVLTKSLSASREAMDILSAKYNRGLIDETVVNEQKSKISQLEQAILAIKRSIELQKKSLCILSGKEPSFTAILKTPTINENKQIYLPKDIYINLLAHRPDITLQKHIVKSKEAKITNAKASFYPNINLSAFLGFISMDMVKFTEVSSYSPSVGAAISLPFFDGGARKANFRIAEYDYDSAVYDYNAIVIKAANEVVATIKKSKLIDEQLRSHNFDLQAKKSNETIATKRLTAGINGRLPTLAATVERLKSEVDEISLQKDRTQTQITLIEALGGGYYDKQGSLDARK